MLLKRCLALTVSLLFIFNDVIAAPPSDSVNQDTPESIPYVKYLGYTVGAGAVVYLCYRYMKARLVPLPLLTFGARMPHANQPPKPEQGLKPDSFLQTLGGSETIVRPRKNSLEGVRIWVAEDNLVNILIIRRKLSSLGAEVHFDENAEDIVTHAIEADVILMDNQMPESKGGKLSDSAGLRAARRIADSVRTPVIMHSSSRVSEDSCAESGAASQILKGVAKDEDYIEAILKAVEERKK